MGVVVVVMAVVNGGVVVVVVVACWWWWRAGGGMLGRSFANTTTGRARQLVNVGAAQVPTSAMVTSSKDGYGVKSRNRRSSRGYLRRYINMVTRGNNVTGKYCNRGGRKIKCSC